MPTDLNVFFFLLHVYIRIDGVAEFQSDKKITFILVRFTSYRSQIRSEISTNLFWLMATTFKGCQECLMCEYQSDLLTLWLTVYRILTWELYYLEVV